MKDLLEWIAEELCAHEGGIVGGVSFSYDDATRDYVIQVGKKRTYTSKTLRRAINFAQTSNESIYED